MPVDVYIYASHPEGSFEGKATWHARYIRLEPERHRAKPYRLMLAAETDAWEGEVYWIVERLRRTEASEHIFRHRFHSFWAHKALRVRQIVSSSQTPSR